jgi:acetylornithine deacetylase/succinyl-diaminopimelate desuccinylase-like protein
MYNNQLGIPTVVFGPGELGVAHSNREQIRLGDILTAAEILVHLVTDWCGGAA